MFGDLWRLKLSRVDLKFSLIHYFDVCCLLKDFHVFGVVLSYVFVVSLLLSSVPNIEFVIFSSTVFV